MEVAAYCPVDYPGDRLAYDSLRLHSQHIDTAAAFLFRIEASGRVSGWDDTRLHAVAKEKEFRLEAVVHNFSGGAFKPGLVEPFLVTLRGRGTAAQAIVDLVVSCGYDGANIDFEGLSPSMRPYFSLFVRNLAGRLKAAGRSLTVTVPAKTRDNPWDSWSGAYDYAALASVADRLIIMAYDEHWAGGTPGPIASLPWVERVSDYAAGAVEPRKILLGVPQYSYDWPASGGPARYITTPEALRIARETGATIMWDSIAQVPHYYYWRGGEKRHVYMENAYSLAFKLRTARAHGFTGIAMWRLGFEDPSAWDLIASYRRSASN
ncbi:MAG: glycosyl hydrolase family 18 protein [Firmicutes bacterium]|jgi:spore germination protein YaaH|nr:glycosyl hydrolase family 18 protein [Bacillota bacterium]